MATKFGGGFTAGTPFEIGESRTVEAADEALSAVSGFVGDTITYTITLVDDTAEKLPAAFVATLKLNGTVLIADQAFDASVYNQTTGELSLDFTVPAAVGTFSIALHWAEQII